MTAHTSMWTLQQHQECAKAGLLNGAYTLHGVLYISYQHGRRSCSKAPEKGQCYAPASMPCYVRQALHNCRLSGGQFLLAAHCNAPSLCFLGTHSKDAALMQDAGTQAGCSREGGSSHRQRRQEERQSGGPGAVACRHLRGGLPEQRHRCRIASNISCARLPTRREARGLTRMQSQAALHLCEECLRRRSGRCRRQRLAVFCPASAALGDMHRG